MTKPYKPPTFVGLQFDKLFGTDNNGELHPLLNHVAIKRGPDRGPGVRSLIVELADITPDPIAGLLELLTGSGKPGLPAEPSTHPTTTAAVSPATPEPAKSGTTSKSKKEPPSTDDLMATFADGYREGTIVDLVDRKDATASDLTGAIGLRKKDPTWDGARLFVLSAAMNAFFPDRKDRRLVVSELTTLGVIVPNEGRHDTNVVSIQVGGKAFNAYRVRRSKLETLLAAY